MHSGSRTKTLVDLWQPSAKRQKLSQLDASKSKPPLLLGFAKPLSSQSQSDSDGSAAAATPVALTALQKSRIELNRLHAQSKRNLKICSDLVSKSKCTTNKTKTAAAEASGGAGYVRLEELLVERTWLEALPGEFQKAYAKSLCKFVENEITKGSFPIYPPQELIFNALNSTPFDSVKAVIIGQDPYHGPGQAMGLSFSVPDGIKPPSSLVNIFKELQHDIGCSIPSHGNLQRWAIQGVLLLNSVLTVRSHQANSHANKGWEQFTDAVIKTISQKKKGVIFLLWGNSAQKKLRLIDETKHHILKAAHPSGLSANRGFFGCRHFSGTNKLLEHLGITPIDWQL